MRNTQPHPKDLQAGKGRVLPVLGERVTLKLTGDESDGTCATVEISTPPQVGPPLHVHQREDEVLFPMADDVLSLEEHAELARGYAEVEARVVGPAGHEALLATLERVEAAIPAGRR